jgi:hypothetical protein
LVLQRLEVRGTRMSDAIEIAIVELESVEREIGIPSKALPLLRALRAADEPADDLYALLVRRGYAQHEAHAIAFGDKLAVLSSSQPPDDDVRNALKEANELCRASFQVCKRVVEQYGDVALGVNFGALEASLDRSLTMQHAVMLKHEMFMPAPTKSEGQ